MSFIYNNVAIQAYSDDSSTTINTCNINIEPDINSTSMYTCKYREELKTGSTSSDHHIFSLYL